MLPLFQVVDAKSPELIGDEAHHANRVLRMKLGEELLVTDGLGNWARCQINDLSKQRVALHILESGVEAQANCTISVLQALPKSDRAREAVELLTAAGVKEIFPWQATRSIGKESDKWQIAAIEASKQSRRFTFPIVSTKLDTESALEQCAKFDQILVCHESAADALSNVVKPADRTLIVIGPEGGITDDELARFKSVGGQIIKLGRPILRSAHAGIAAVGAVSALLKVW